MDVDQHLTDLFDELPGVLLVEVPFALLAFTVQGTGDRHQEPAQILQLGHCLVLLKILKPLPGECGDD